MPSHEWNSDRGWKDDGWQYYDLDLKTWVFEEESFVPMALIQEGKAYSIVYDQLGMPRRLMTRGGSVVSSLGYEWQDP